MFLAVNMYQHNRFQRTMKAIIFEITLRKGETKWVCYSVWYFSLYVQYWKNEISSVSHERTGFYKDELNMNVAKMFITVAIVYKHLVIIHLKETHVSNVLSLSLIKLVF